MNIRSKLTAAGGTVSSSAGAAGTYAASLVKMTRLYRKIYAQQNLIRNAEEQLGEMYYADRSAGLERNDSAYLAVCARITEAKKEIACLEEELEDLRRERRGEVSLQKAGSSAEK